MVQDDNSTILNNPSQYSSMMGGIDLSNYNTKQGHFQAAHGNNRDISAIVYSQNASKETNTDDVSSASNTAQLHYQPKHGQPAYYYQPPGGLGSSQMHASYGTQP